MSNIIVSPVSGIIEFNTGAPSGSAFHTSTAPIRLDATGGNTWITGSNVGIGTTNPSTELHVEGDIRVGGATSLIDLDSNAKIVGQYYNNGEAELTFLKMYNGADASINMGTKHALGYISFAAGNGAYTERMRIKNDGNVGIGTTTPSGLLHVDERAGASDTTNYGIFSYLNGGANSTNIAGYFSATSASDNIALKTVGRHMFGGNIRVTEGYIDQRSDRDSQMGNIFVGDTTAGYIAGNGGTIVFAGDSVAQGIANSTFASIRGIKENGSYNTSLGALVFGTQDDAGSSQQLDSVSEKMRITSDGYVGIGTGDPYDILEVYKAADPKIILSDANSFKIALTTDGTNGAIQSLNSSYATHKTPISFDLNTAALTTQALNVTSATSTTVLTMGNNSHRIYSEPNDFAIVQTTSSYKAFRLLGNVPAETLVLESNGYVGVGTSAPLTRLDVRGTISGSGDFLGTGVGNRITLNGTGYLLSGDSPAETQTLQQVTDRGSTTTNSITSSGPHISGVKGLFSDKVGIGGTGAPTTHLSVINNTPGSNVLANFGATTMDGATRNGGLQINQTDSQGDKTWGIWGKGLGSYNGALKFTYLGTRATSLSAGTDILTLDSAGFVGIGTSVPAEELHVSGSSTTTVRVDGSAVNLEIQSEGSTRASVGTITDHPLRLVSNDTERLTILGDGKVGIGTNNPDQNLVVYGGGNIAAKIKHTNVGWLQFENTNGNYWHIEHDYGDNDLRFGTSVSNGKLTLTEGGNVGIGTLSPSGLLHVWTATAGAGTPTNTSHDDLIIENNTHCGIQLSSPASSYQYLAFGDEVSANQGYVRYYHGDDRMDLRAGGTDTLTIRGGNVGIGTTDPSSKLHIVGEVWSINNGANTRYLLGDNTSNGNWGGLRWDSTNDYLQIIDSNYSTTEGAINIRGSEGRVGIGTTNPQYALDVSGSVAGTGVGNRITLNGTGYLLSGDSPAETQTLQQVCDNGSTTTTSVTISDDLIVDTDTLFVDASENRVGIGTNNPAETLHVDGNILIPQNKTLQGYYGGSIPHPIIGMSSTIDTIIYASGNNSSDIFFKTNSAGTLDTRMTILNAGKVGIGTDAPDELLHISGASASLRVDSRSDGATLILNDVDGVTGMWAIKNRNGDSRLGFSRSDGGGTDLVSFDLNGNVGIGTVSPNALLEINDNIPRFSLYDTATSKRWEINKQYGGLNFAEIGVADKRLFLKDGGGVGIGVDPTEDFEVFQAGKFKVDATDSPIVYITNNSATSSTNGTATLKFQQGNTQDGGSIIGGRDGNYSDGASRDSYMAFLTATNATDSEKMRITTAGNVGIGTSAPSGLLHVDGEVTLPSSLYFRNNAASIQVGSSWNTSVLSFLNGATAYLEFDVPNSRIKNNLGKYLTASSNAAQFGTLDGYDTTFVVSGVEKMRINTDGKVGIGTASASYAFEVHATNAAMSINNGTTSRIVLSNDSTTNTLYSQGSSSANKDFGIRIGTTERMRIAADGSVGIGTTAPLATLDVRGTISGSGDFLGTGVGNRITNNGTPYLLSGDSPAETQTLQQVCDNDNSTTTSILSTGPHISGVTGLFSHAVGIGTSVPAAPFNIVSTSDHTKIQLENDNSDRWNILVGNAGYYQGAFMLQKVGGGGEALTVNTNSLVGIGTNQPSYRLDVNSSTTDQVARFRSTDADAFISIQDNYDSVYLGHSSGDNVMSLGFSSTMGSTSNLSINPLGHVGIGTNVPDNNVPLTILGPSAGRFMTLDAPTNGGYITFETAGTAYADIGSEKGALGAGAVDDLLINVRGSRELIFRTNSTERLRINSAGNVGIGVTNPNVALQVSGSTTLGAEESDATQTIRGSTILLNTRPEASATRGVQIQDNGLIGFSAQGANGLGIFSNADTFLGGPNQASAAILIKNGGNVGIGLTEGVMSSSPYKLRISGDIAGTGIGDRITLNGTGYLLSGDSPAETQTLQQVCDNDNSTTTSILSTGPHISGVTGLFSHAVGIGTGDPTGVFEIVTSDEGARNTNEDALVLTRRAAGSYPYYPFGNSILFRGETYRTNSIAATYLPHARIKTQLRDSSLSTEGVDMSFELMATDTDATPTERMRITSTGYVGIGLTDPDANLHIYQDSPSANQVLFQIGTSDDETRLTVDEDGDMSLDGQLSVAGPIVTKGNIISSYDSADELAIQVGGDTIFKSWQSSVGWTETVRIEGYADGGYVGIGTSAPAEKLEVSGNIRISDGKSLKLYSSSNIYNGSIYKDSYNGTIDIGNQTNIKVSSVLEIDSDAGDIQLGQSSTYSYSRVAIWPRLANKFAVYAGVSDLNGISGAGFGFYNQGSAGKMLAIVPHSMDDTEGAFKFQTMSGSSVIEAARFSIDGRFGIGTNAPSYKLDVGGDVGGTGVGDRITLNGTPYLLSGDAASALTLQDVCDNDNSTTTSILSTGPHISGVTGLFSDKVGIGTNAPAYPLQVVGNVHADRYYVGTNTYFGSAGTHHGLISVAAGSYGLSVYCNNDDLNINTASNAGLGFSNGHSESYNTVDARFFRHSAGVIGLGTTFGSAANGTLIAGSVGIGTTTLAAAFEVSSTSDSATNGQVRITNSNNTVGDKTIVNNAFLGTAGFAPVGYGAVATAVGGNGSRKADFVVYVADDDNWVDGDERLRITSDGNVGIGITDPSKKLTVISDDNLGPTEIIAAYSNNEGQHTALGYNSLVGSYELDLFTLTTQPITFRPNSVERMRVTNDGYVGIGTTSPNSTLQVTGDIYVGDETATSIGRNFQAYSAGFGVTKNSLSTIVAKSAIAHPTENSSLKTTNYSTDGVLFYSQNYARGHTWHRTTGYNLGVTIDDDEGELMRLTTGGYVGIGTSSPAALLNVDGNVRINRPSDGGTYQQIEVGDVNTTFNGQDPDGWMNYSFNSNDTTRVYIRGSDGNVGIGTTVPNGALHVNVENTRQLLFTRLATGPSATDGTYMGQGGTDFSIINQEAGNLYLGTSNTNRLTIEAGGDVGIGTTNPTTKLNIVIDDAQDAGGTALKLENAIGECKQDIYGANNETAGAYGANRGGANLNLRNIDTTAGNYSLLSFSNAASYIFGGIHGVSTVTGVTDQTEGKLEFWTRNATDNYHLSMTVDEDGKVGIGTDNPTEALEVAGDYIIVNTDSSYGGVRIKNGGTTRGYLYGDGNGISLLDAHGNYAITVDNDGTSNVGIGTTAPSEALDVKGNIALDSTITGKLILGGAGELWANPNGNSVILRKVGNANQINFGTQLGTIGVANDDGTYVELLAPQQEVRGSSNISLSIVQHGAASNNNGKYLEVDNSTATAGNKGAVYVNGDFHVQDYSTSSAVLKAEIRNDGSAYFYGPHISGVTGLFSERVGIGTATPTKELHVQGAAYATGAVIGDAYVSAAPPTNGLIVQGDVGIGIYYAGSSQLSVYENASIGAGYYGSAAPSNGLLVQGNVGIGTSNPSTELHVDGTITCDDGITTITPLTSDTSTAYTLVIGDQGNMVSLSNASAVTLTIPANSAVAFPIGTEISAFQAGAGQVTIAGAGGVTVNAADAELKTRVQYSSATLYKTASDTWLVVGDLTA